MTYADLPRLLTMAIVWLLLLTWQFNAYRSNCVATLALVVLFTLLLFVSGAELALYRRRVFLNECMTHKGLLFRWLRRRYVLLGIELLKSAALAVFLLVSVLSFSPRHWSLLFADVLLVGLLLPRFYGALKGQLREEYRFTTARRWALWVSTLLLWLESILVLVFTVAQDYDGMRWQEVITFGATDPDVLCRPLASLAALADLITEAPTSEYARASLVDSRDGGIIVTDADPSRILQPVGAQDEAFSQAAAGNRGTLESRGSSGEVDLASFAPLGRQSLARAALGRRPPLAEPAVSLHVPSHRGIGP